MFRYDKNTTEGDNLAKKEVKRFFKSYLDKFGSDLFLLDEVLEDLCNSDINYIKDSPDYTSAYALDVEEGLSRCKEIGAFAKDFLRSIDIQGYVEVYRKEWERVLCDVESYSASQYNAMQLRGMMKCLVAYFIRGQLYEIYRSVCKKHHELSGNTVYLTSMDGIEQFGVYAPRPIFPKRGDEEETLSRMSHKEKLRYKGNLTTDHPDIAILAPLFHKHGVIPFIDGVSRFSGYDCPARKMEMLCKLKYVHLNLGETKRRKVLDIKSKRVHHIEALDNKSVIGSWR